MWAEGKTVLFRTAIFVGMASVVTTIIYFTPIPGQEFKSCDRICHELEMPMICRLKLTFELYQTLTRSCAECPKNSTACYHKHCISGDGTRRNMITANRQLPGTSLHVCENDILVIDVINRLPGQEVTLHWRGQPVDETPFMDGVPLITQCPVSSFTTFQYKFRASVPGTHVWHAHSDGDIDGQFGALIVRQTESKNSQAELYDVDLEDHVIFVNIWKDNEGNGTLLINGKTKIQRDGLNFPPAVFHVASGLKHRFRLINTGGRGNICPIRLSLDKHRLKVISLDGHGVIPRDVDAITLSAGERVDFVVNANQMNSSYLLLATTLKPCPFHLTAIGVFQYDTSSLLVQEDAVDMTGIQKDVVEMTGIQEDDVEMTGIQEDAVEMTGIQEDAVEMTGIQEDAVEMTTGTCAKRQGKEICLPQLEGLEELEEGLTRLEVDTRVVLEFGYSALDDSLGNLTSYFADSRVPNVNNISFTYPSSPLLTQPADIVSTDMVCNKDSRPARCPAGVCECVHVITVRLHDSVELILDDLGGHSHLEHVFHLHGQSFHIVSLSRKKVISRNVERAVMKDTIRVPHKGVATLRFRADNAGYWLLSNDRSRQLNVVFQVGLPSDLPYIPEQFPRCGSWIGPDFFLI